MIYRLHRDGQNLGAFSLAELQRRRQAGELDGVEFAWREGMADWERLDAVLEREARNATLSGPPPVPGARREGLHPAALVAIVGGVGLFIAGLIFVGYKAANTARSILPVISTRNGGIRFGTGQSALAVARKPVSWTTNTLTAAQTRKEDGDFRRRQWLEGYEQRGDRTEACDAEALRFLQAWMDHDYGSNSAISSADLTKMADQLTKNPACTDPLVLAAAALHLGSAAARFSCLERALATFPASKHRGYPQFNTAITLATDAGDQSPRLQTFDEAALQALRQAFADGSVQPGDQAQYAEILINGWAKDFFKRNASVVVRLAKNSGTPYEWLSLVLAGENQINVAWQARGGGYANTVNARGWQTFHEQLAEARISLTRAWGLHPNWPLAPTRMMTVALGDEDVGEMRLWFDRAVAGQIDYPGAWSEMRWGLRPRWYGDPESMLAFGVTAVNTGRYDTDVPRKFIDVVNDLEAEEELPPGTHMYGRADIWPRVQQVYDGYVANTPAGQKRDAWRTIYAMMAYVAGKYDVARTQFEALNWKPVGENMTDWSVDPSLVPQEAAARAGSMGTKVTDAEIARDQHDLARAAALYAEIRQGATDPQTREFARCRLAAVALEQKLDTGDWVDFLPQSDDDGNWVYSWGEGKRQADGSLEARTAHNGHLFYSRARMGQDFEVKGEFEVDDATSRPFQAGLVMGLPDCGSNLGSYHWYGFRIEGTGSSQGRASFGRGWSGNAQVVLPVELTSASNTFDFILHGDTCTVTVNGRPVFTNTRVPKTIDSVGENFFLGVGAYSTADGTVVRYRNVQVRKLKQGQS